MSKPHVAVIAQGAMGAATAQRLTAAGVDVVTSLAGRSEASAARARDAGMRPVNDSEIAAADIILSIVPPAEAVPLAERLAPTIATAKRKPVFADCNAISTATALDVGRALAASGAIYVDGCIIGYPPRAGTWGTVYYFSGPEAKRLGVLANHGLEVSVLDAPIGAASALKMSYASVSKGLTAIASAAILSAEKHGAADALRTELLRSQPQLLTTMKRAIPDMFSKAYRFVGEMEEIADQSQRASTAAIYRGMAEFYAEIARDQDGAREDIARLERFLQTARKQEG